MKRAAVLVVALGMVLLAGCGGDDDAEADSPESGNGGTDVSDDTADDDEPESGDAGSSGATDTGGFAIPAPDGGTVILEIADTGLSIDYPVGDFDRIVQFYDEWVADQPYPFNVIEGPDSKDYATDPLETERRQSITILRVDDVTNVILGNEFE